jgi:hypothetical protein
MQFISELLNEGTRNYICISTEFFRCAAVRCIGRNMNLIRETFALE